MTYNLLFNFSPSNCEYLDEFVFECNQKKWYKNELKLSSCHIGDDSEVRIQISYHFGKVEYATHGFIGKKQYKDFYEDINKPDDVVLESVLTTEESIGGRRFTHDNEWEGF